LAFLWWNTLKEKGWEAPHIGKAGRKVAHHELRECRISPRRTSLHVSLFEAEPNAGCPLPDWLPRRNGRLRHQDCRSKVIYVESEIFHVALLLHRPASNPGQMFGDVWEWTRSSYSPYPGYSAVPGALGEYNAKFMCNQYVLRGGSCATLSRISATHTGTFFPPDARCQYHGNQAGKDLI